MTEEIELLCEAARDLTCAKIRMHSIVHPRLPRDFARFVAQLISAGRCRPVLLSIVQALGPEPWRFRRLHKTIHRNAERP